MRFSTLLLALIPATAFAAPVPAPGFLDDLLKKIPGVGAVTDAITHPELLVARLQVAGGLDQTKGALKSIIAEAAGGPNVAVGTTAETALGSVNNAQVAVQSILKAILTSKTPQRSDQTTVAQNVFNLQGQIGQLASQVVNPSNQLTNDINDATRGMKLAVKGTQGVLDASGISPADVGLTGPLVARDI